MQRSKSNRSLTSLVSVTSKDDDEDESEDGSKDRKSVLSVKSIEDVKQITAPVVRKPKRKRKEKSKRKITKSTVKTKGQTDTKAKSDEEKGRASAVATTTITVVVKDLPVQDASLKKVKEVTSGPLIKTKETTIIKQASKEQQQVKEILRDKFKEVKEGSLREYTKEVLKEQQKDQIVKEVKSKTIKILKLEDPSLLASKRSAEPPPMVTDDDSSIMFTPSEISIYLDNDKDLCETTICKKQQTSILSSLKTPFLKVPPLRPRMLLRKTDQTEASINELENLILTTEISDHSPESSPEEDQQREKKLQEQQDKAMSARNENLIMDPAIFEAEYKQQEEAQEVVRVSSGTSAASVQMTAETAVAPSVLPEEQFEHPVVIYSYKAKREQRKKKKKKKKAEIRIGLIGAGKMSEAIVNTLIETLKFSPNIIHISSPSGRNLDLFKAKGCQTTKRNIDIFTRFFCHIIFINIHGGVIKYCYKLGGKNPFPLTTRFIPVTRHRFYIFSLVTGVSLEEIKSCLFIPEQISKYQFEIHRIMLNVCCIYGTSICGVDCELSKLSPIIKIFLEKFGDLEYIPEKEMDAACAIGGSGLEFAYYLLNAISDGSVRIGLTKDTSVRLVSQIAVAAVDCLNRSDEPDKLFDYLAQGTPALIGIEQIKKQNLTVHIENAVKAAYERINELANTEIAPAFSSSD